MAENMQSNNAPYTGKRPVSKLKKKIKKYLYLTLVFLILVTGIFIYWSYFFTYSDGYRAGLLQKFSRKGTIFKTYEGEMILSSVQSSGNVTIASEKFLFSVVDNEVAMQLEKLQGHPVVVHYSQKNNALPWRGESAYVVNSVKPEDQK
jgi:hypothetical protein